MCYDRDFWDLKKKQRKKTLKLLNQVSFENTSKFCLSVPVNTICVSKQVMLKVYKITTCWTAYERSEVKVTKCGADCSCAIDKKS